jgi:hypothetical protein
MATEALPPLPKGAKLVSDNSYTAPPLPSGALNIDSLDKDTGALKSLRATVSSYKKPEDKLKIIKKYYPDAIPFGSDNYVFKNPKTKRPTLFILQNMVVLEQIFLVVLLVLYLVL